MPAPPGPTTDLLTLADWRRRVALLYTEVRSIAAGDPAAAWEHWRSARDELYRSHPQSPVPADTRPSFEGRYFPYQPALRMERVTIEPAPPPAPGALPLALPK